MNLDILSSMSAALLHGLWQSALIALLVVLSLRWVSSAKHRYALLWGALLVSLVLPVAYFFAQPGRILAVHVSDSAPGPVTSGVDWTPVFVGLWVVGAVFALGRIVTAWIKIRMISNECEPAAPELRSIRDGLLPRMNIRRYVRVRTSLDVDAPATIGSRRPIVVWPALGFDTLSVSEQEALVAHELAHIQRNDYALHLVQRFVEAVLWCNPAAQWLGYLLRQEREKAADELAAEVLQDGRGLAIALGRLALQNANRGALSLAAGDGDVTDRMRTLKVWRPQALTLRSISGIVMALFVLGGTALITASVAAGTKVQTIRVKNELIQIPFQATEKKKAMLFLGSEIGHNKPMTVPLVLKGMNGGEKTVYLIEMKRVSNGPEGEIVETYRAESNSGSWTASTSSASGYSSSSSSNESSSNNSSHSSAGSSSNAGTYIEVNGVAY